MKTYAINECFYSLQGEGARAGTANVFLRFSGCNLQCTREAQGFDCDTDFRFSKFKLALEGVVGLVKGADKSEGGCGWVICTGGEPLLQLDGTLVQALGEAGYYVAIETNGTLEVPPGIAWVSCSPKPGHPPVIKHAREVRCVVQPGVEPNDYGIDAEHYFVSPAFRALNAQEQDDYRAKNGHAWQGNYASFRDPAALEYAIRWCRRNPKWRLSVQQHKQWGVR